MAKAKSPAVSTDVEPRNLAYVWKNSPHLPTELGVKYILATFTPVPGARQWFEKGGRPDLIHLLVGHSGCGKTQMLQSALAANGFDIEKLKGEATIEDIVPIPTQRPDPERPGMALKLAQTRNFGPAGGDRKLGALFIDEFTSGEVEHQKVFRGLISDNMLAQLPADPRWLPVGACNPCDREYTDTRPITRSLEDRCFYLPVTTRPETTLRFFGGVNNLLDIRVPEMGRPVAMTPQEPSGAGGINEKLYTFLMMHSGNSISDFMKFNSARRWQNISWALNRFESSGFVTDNEILTWFSTVNHEEVAAAFRQHWEMGADADAYPILGHKWLGASPADVAVYVDRIRGWAKNPDRKHLIKLTQWDLTGALLSRAGDPSAKLTQSQGANVRAAVNQFDETMIANMLHELTAAPDVQSQVWEILHSLKDKSAKLRKLLEELSMMTSAAITGNRTGPVQAA